MFAIVNAIKRSHISKTMYQIVKSSQTYRFSSSLEDRFKSSLNNLKKLSEEPDNDVKLKLYALFKQSTVGECSAPKPSVFNIVDKAKWEAWTALGKMSVADAQQQYIATVDQLLKDSNISVDADGSGGGGVDAKEPAVLSSIVDGVLWIKYNRPKKFNALNLEMFEAVPKLLQDAANDESVKLAVLTGVGNYYSSGNDLSNFLEISKQFDNDLNAGTKAGAKILQKFVASFIDFPKPLIGAVNGPALGISATTLALMDCVIASDSATFQTPFSALGQSPEACSSLMFPAIMGSSRAGEMLLFNYKMSAKEAEQCGFVSRVIPSDKFESYLQNWLYGEQGLVKTCFPKSMMISKGLIRTEEMRMKLHQINKDECETLSERWVSDECTQAIQQFMTRKSNL